MSMVTCLHDNLQDNLPLVSNCLSVRMTSDEIGARCGMDIFESQMNILHTRFFTVKDYSLEHPMLISVVFSRQF